MRFLSTFAVLICTCSLAVAGDWEEFLQRRAQGDPAAGRWAVCVRPGEFSHLDAYPDATFRRLLTGGDCVLEPLPPALAKDLWNQRGWGSAPHWLLLSPAGKEVADGAGRPKGEQVLDGIHRTGARPRWEARAEFLEQNPGQGEARLEALAQAFQMVRLHLQALDRQGKVQIPAWHQEPGARAGYVPPRVSLPPGSQGEGMADELYADVAEALEPLLTLPGWQREASPAAAHLAYWDVSQSFRLRRLLAQAALGLGESLKADPYDLDLANFWMEASDAGGQGLGNLAGLCLPLPGVPWPDPDLLSRFLEPSIRRRDWSGALKMLADLAPQAPPEPVTAGSWNEYCRLQSAIHAQRALALAGQGAWDLAGSALAEARHWGGSQGVREALLQRGSLFTGPGGDPAAWRQLLAQALGRGGETLPPAPEPVPPLRLVVSGMPPWIVPWTSLRQAPELALWSPAELQWEVSDRTAHDQRLARHGWGPGPRWILYRGEAVLASGQTCPSGRTLAAILEGHGEPMLERLQRLLDAQPGHLAARRERFELLLKRMPDRGLEPLLAEDAARALLPLEFDLGAPWRPDASLWAGAAQKALPVLEEQIRAWPNRTHLWRAWVSWARFHPAQPSVLAMVQSVAFWSPRGDWRSWLPYEVQRQVAAELRRQGNFTAMREWFRAVWDTLDRRPLRSLFRGEQRWVLDRRREEETAVFQPLRDALKALACTQEQAELEREFGEMMGRGREPEAVNVVGR